MVVFVAGGITRGDEAEDVDMARTVPLIRAATLAPFLRWMRSHGVSIEPVLVEAGLGPLALADPDRPIPLIGAAAFIAALARRAGPDVACRVIDGASVQDLGPIGAIALAARTPHEGLVRVSAHMALHCSHETTTVAARPDGILVRDVFTMPFDPVTLHMVHQYFAALVGAFIATTGAQGQLLSRVEIVPHPVFGLEHLRSWFGPGLVASAGRGVALFIDATVAERRIPTGDRRPRSVDLARCLSSLRGDGSLAASARILIAGLLEDGEARIEDVARAALMSRRTLQRRLAEEGVSYSGLVEDLRREAALLEIETGRLPFSAISASLGYSNQSALTRAVRRWTGAAPRQVRHAGER
jgi:AraC-like DNA-binding protein